MKRIKYLLVILLTILPDITFAARIDTLSIASNKMRKEIRTIVITPEATDSCNRFPVIYLLHGHGGNEYSWLEIKPTLKQMCDKDRIIVVCPNGENNWYWDSPKNKDSQFETFISKELVNYIDSNYNTIKDRKFRAIMGLSMGGHGSLWISMRNKDVFGACGSTSGGVDIVSFPDKWDMEKQLGLYNDNKKTWYFHSVINNIDKIQDKELAIIIDCGTEDYFFDINNKLHSILLKKGISHDYICREGKHNKTYWNNSIDYQWLFFKKFFTLNQFNVFSQKGKTDF